jgi:hypothetical protein
MTTTPIYEPIASISDDYFRPLREGGVVTDAMTLTTARTSRALNIADVIGWTAQKFPPDEERLAQQLMLVHIEQPTLVHIENECPRQSGSGPQALASHLADPHDLARPHRYVSGVGAR